MFTDISSLQPSPFFVLRTALLPWNHFEAWGVDLEAPRITSETEAPEDVFNRDKTRLREYLRNLLSEPMIQEALFIASPDLDAALVHWFENPESPKGARAERSIIRYFSRLCGRSTPFGLFAGCSVGSRGEVTRLTTEGSSLYQRHTRLDMDYLSTLTEDLNKNPNLRRELTLRPNSSIYRVGGKLRYTEARTRDKVREYHLVGLEETPYLLDVLRRASNGATFRDLAQSLITEEVSLEEAEVYLDSLIDNQVLITDLNPTITGMEPTHHLIATLQSLANGEVMAEPLRAASDALIAIDGSPLGVSPETYRTIARGLDALPTKVEINRLFQVDMTKPAPGATLGPEVSEEIVRGILLLQKLFASGANDPLQRFVESFKTRYEEREVPLVEALDEESGIGFDAARIPASEDSPLLEGLGLQTPEGESTVRWTRFQNFLVSKLLETRQKNSTILRFDFKDLEPFFLKSHRPLPNSISAMVKLEARDENAFQRGDFKVYLGGISGPSGANLLGRFCHGDQALKNAVLDHLREEESLDPDAIYAEIVHLPQGRLGNVLLRPLLRNFEIPYLGQSGAPIDQQIPLTDLMVSVRQGKITLRSLRLGKEVKPRLTNAHNFSQKSLGVYRFLCMLQHQGLAAYLSWSWGALDRVPFLPRVEMGRLVLSPAVWNVGSREIEAITKTEGRHCWNELAAWRLKRQIPRFVLISDGDNKLPVDFDNILSVQNFIDLVKKRQSFSLEEFPTEAKDLPVEGPEGRFCHELVVPFIRRTVEKSSLPELRNHSLQRIFSPGSEWLFAKIYMGTSTVDQLLRDEIGSLIEELKSEEVIDSWFFIRYGDPEWHLRLRLHGNPDLLWGRALPKLHSRLAELLTQGKVWKVQLDTYQREIERYGGEKGMLLAEHLFQIDSEAVLSILETYRGDAAADVRWRLCLAGMDLLLEDMGFDCQGKATLMAELRHDFGQEFQVETLTEQQFGSKFRKERKGLEELLQGRTPSLLQEGMDILRRRSEALRGTMQELNGLDQKGELLGGLPHFAKCILHMHANRLFRSAGRAQELVTYDYLSRIYNSQLARAK